MITLIKNMFRAIKLDEELYEEIPVNHSFIYQSIFIIILSSLSAGISKCQNLGGQGLVLMTVTAIFSWILWGYCTFFMANLLEGSNIQNVDLKEMIRMTGFASTPGIIRAIGIIPELYGLVFIVSGIWMLVMMTTTIKHAYDFDILHALGVSLAGGVIPAIILWIFP